MPNAGLDSTLTNHPRTTTLHLNLEASPASSTPSASCHTGPIQHNTHIHTRMRILARNAAVCRTAGGEMDSWGGIRVHPHGQRVCHFALALFPLFRLCSFVRTAHTMYSFLLISNSSLSFQPSYQARYLGPHKCPRPSYSPPPIAHVRSFGEPDTVFTPVLLLLLASRCSPLIVHSSRDFLLLVSSPLRTHDAGLHQGHAMRHWLGPCRFPHPHDGTKSISSERRTCTTSLSVQHWHGTVEAGT